MAMVSWDSHPDPKYFVLGSHWPTITRDRVDRLANIYRRSLSGVIVSAESQRINRCMSLLHFNGFLPQDDYEFLWENLVYRMEQMDRATMYVRRAELEIEFPACDAFDIEESKLRRESPYCEDKSEKRRFLEICWKLWDRKLFEKESGDVGWYLKGMVYLASALTMAKLEKERVEVIIGFWEDIFRAEEGVLKECIERAARVGMGNKAYDLVS